MNGLATLLLLVPLAPALDAQIGSTVGPPVAPLGCPIAIAMSNDGLVDTSLADACPFEVHTAAGVVVFDLSCPTLVPIPLGVGDTVVSHWDLTDNFGQPVLPGDYLVSVEVPIGPPQVHKVKLGGPAAALAQLGVTHIGTARHFELCAPQDPGLPYLLAAAFSSTPPIQTCAGQLPLAADALFFLSLQPSAVFVGFSGTLDAQGRSTVPALAVPNDPGLVGISFVLGYVVIDLAQTCPIRTISAPLPIKIH
ncbi:MAG: hypothetical protein FJ299_08545 [Planctomycetes bacterium]|nr:hypothetical protein [Planctomycetota bacterium]